MVTPLFKVGEEVILKSVSCPECNGEYIVVKVLSPEEIFKSRNDGQLMRNGGTTYSYLLDEVFQHTDHGFGEICWDESALRKKYKPSEFTFDQLMDSLNLEVV